MIDELDFLEAFLKDDNGDAQTPCHLAELFLYGKGDEKDYSLGMKYMISSANNGNIKANNWLADACLSLAIPSCLTTKHDSSLCYEFAFKWCNEEALGVDAASANLFLGLLYYTGKGVEKNDNLAFECFEIALKADYLNDCGCECDDDVIFKDLIRLYLSICYAQGKGIEKDLNKAEQYQSSLYLGGLGKLFMEGIIGFSDYDFQVARIFIIRLRINMYLVCKEYDLAKQFVENVFENTYGLDRGYNRVYLHLIAETKRKDELYKALHEKEKEMLSFFTHTMRNALATAPESLRQAIHLLGGEVYEKDTKHYQAINKIAALFSTLSLTDCLIDTFKQSISDPQEFRQSWQNDHTGEATPKWVIASALRQALNRIIFMSDTTELRKLLNNPETALIKATRKSFIEEVLPLNVDSHGVEVFYSWTLTHILAVEVSITDSDTLNFGVNQIRFSLLFAITSELILNALKYWDGENRIQIAWQLTEQGSYVFSVKNHCKANASSNLAGTHKGLAFINRLVELLGDHAQFVCKSEGQLFTAELILTKALFDGAS